MAFFRIGGPTLDQPGEERGQNVPLQLVEGTNIAGCIVTDGAWHSRGMGCLWAVTSDGQVDDEGTRALALWLHSMGLTGPDDSAESYSVGVRPMLSSRRQGHHLGDKLPSEALRIPGEIMPNVLLWLAKQLAFAQMTQALSLCVRLLRLAARIVAIEEVMAFAAPENLPVDAWLAVCSRLAQTDEDAWVAWSSHVEPFVSAWLPTWATPELRALRAAYIAQATAMSIDDTEHGTLVDWWLSVCTDVLVRYGLEPAAKSHATVTASKSTYRIAYRGEEEVVSSWRDALWAPVSGDRTFAGDGWLIWRTLRQAMQSTGWRTSTLFDSSGQHHFHIELELSPPVEGDMASGRWRLGFYVAHNTWSVRAALIEYWHQPSQRWQLGPDVLEQPERWVLPALHAAGQVCPVILEGLRDPAPSGCPIASDAVFTFVTEQAPALTELGFTVRTPSLEATNLKDVRIRVQVKRVTTKGNAKRAFEGSPGWFDAGQLVDFDWTVVIGDKELTRSEFETLVEKQAPYLQLGGSWRLIPVDAILRQVQLLRGTGKPGTPMNLLEWSRSVLMSQQLLDDDVLDAESVALDVEYGADAGEALRAVRGLVGIHDEPPLSAPEGFHGQLRSYQRIGYSWLLRLRMAGFGACLADDMGLGKTIQVLAYLMQLKEESPATGPHLLVCPTSLLRNWMAEMARFTPGLRIYVHHGPERNSPNESGQNPLLEALGEMDVVLTTYATVVRDVDLLHDCEWDVVIADEAQNIKNAHTKQAQAIRQLSGRHRVALTGTPIENRLEELWAIFQFVNPGYLGTLAWFRKMFAGPISAGPHSPASRRLRGLLHPVLLRRRKTDPVIQMELPEKWEVNEYAALTAEQAALYQSIVNQLFVRMEDRQSGMDRRGHILAALVRLKQVCDHPCLLTGGKSDIHRSGKLQMLMDLLEDVVSDDEAAIVFTQFRDMGELLCDAMESRFGWRPKFLHGGLTAAARGKLVEDFQSGADSSPVLVLSLKAGGVGLNLTRANHVFHFDRWWNPAVEDQATDRVFRIGQHRDVQVHKLVCSGTLEERIDSLIAAKRALSTSVVGTSEGWVTELDDDALRQLFALDAGLAMEEDEA